MNKQTVFNILPLFLALGLAAFITRTIPGAQTSPVAASLNSTLVPSLAPAPGLSVETRKILAYLIEHEGIAAENLVIVNEFRRKAALLDRMFWAVTVMDLESGRSYQMLVDLNSGQVENRRYGRHKSYNTARSASCRGNAGAGFAPRRTASGR